MITVSKEVEFDAGHRVPGHVSKCRNPHGHRYRVQVTCAGEIITTPGDPAEGMLIDFGDLKCLMTEKVADVLDHGFIVYAADTPMLDALQAGEDQDGGWKVIVFPYIPTAENLARWVWEQLNHRIERRFAEGLRLHRVRVWETPTSVATVDDA